MDLPVIGAARAMLAHARHAAAAKLGNAVVWIGLVRMQIKNAWNVRGPALARGRRRAGRVAL
nr:hypothetical protein [Cupriavidus gilardii]